MLRDILAAIFSVLIIIAAQAQPAANVPTVEPLTHKPYTETIERDGIKATFDMVPIPAGVFRMGSPDGEKGRKEFEGPQHPVRVNAFWMGKCEVTWGEYDLYWEKKADEKKPLTAPDKKADAITRPSKANHHDIDWGYGRGKNQPVIAISHHAAMEYCRWLSLKTGKLYRLPTEAEWEWACRAGTTTAYSFGDDASKIGDYAWIDKNSNDMPHPIAKKKPNPWGLYDMHGNVAEWCIDQFDAKFYSSLSPEKATLLPVKLPIDKRFNYVARGGSWIESPEKCRSACRDFSVPGWQKQDPQIPQSIWWNNADWVGFRVVRAVEEYEVLKNLQSKVTKKSPN